MKPCHLAFLLSHPSGTGNIGEDVQLCFILTLNTFYCAWRSTQVSRQLEKAESDKRAQEQELEAKGRELFKTQVHIHVIT